MKKIASVVIAAIFALALVSCDKVSQNQKKKSFMPNVTGAAGEVIIVLNKDVWEEPIGKAYTDILKTEYPRLPQSEPIFDAVMIPPNAFSDIFKSHRNIVITKVGAEFKEAQIITQRDVWAAPQTVLNIVGPTYIAIANMIEEEKDRFVQILEQAERDRVVQNAIRYEAKGLRKLLEKKFEVSMRFPRGYQLMMDTTDFVWISHETPDISQGVFIYQYDYTDTETFTVNCLVEKRNSFVNRYVSGPTDGSYMITETLLLPVFQSIMYKSRYFGQLRGLWDVHLHPMGGPFVSYTTIDEERSRVITVEGYVFAPRFNKRNYIRQLEALLLTFEIISEQE